jgi:hypothetical protein
MARQPDLWILVEDLRRHTPAVVVKPGEGAVDAIGRQWVPNALALAALERVAEEQQADLDSRQAYARWVDDLALRRKALAEKLRDEGGGSTTPASSAEARGRVQAALQRFDEQHPALDYYRWMDKR